MREKKNKYPQQIENVILNETIMSLFLISEKCQPALCWNMVSVKIIIITCEKCWILAV